MRLALLVLTLIVSYSCGNMRPEAKPSGSPNDNLYKEQRSNRINYSESATINACPDNSSTCYTLVASINHHFIDDGKESTTVETVHFDNGGYLSFKSAPIPGTGVDQRGKSWSLSW